MWRRRSITFAGMERYALANPGLTKIKLAENYARQAGMEAFFKKTFRRAGILGAAVLLLVLAALWGGGAGRRRTSSRLPVGYIPYIPDSYSIYSPIHSARVISDFFESRPRDGPQLGS